MVLGWIFTVTVVLSFYFAPQQRSPCQPFLPGASPGCLKRVRSHPSASYDADIGSDNRPEPQPWEGGRLSSLVPTTLTATSECKWDQLFQCHSGQASSGRGIELPACVLLARNLGPSSLLGETSQPGVWFAASEMPAIELFVKRVVPSDSSETTCRSVRVVGIQTHGKVFAWEI